MTKNKEEDHRYAIDSLRNLIDHISRSIALLDMDHDLWVSDFENGKVTEEEFRKGSKINRNGRETRQEQLDEMLSEIDKGGFNLDTKYIDFLNSINSKE
ncbi:hypothetical protein JXA63_05485 [Candidatus Woesebacteria bacterium]|nr:hypothetical protein [Candidatus Woesebacteria bacterium]